jgi:SAM-dependent methyltransferase
MTAIPHSAGLALIYANRFAGMESYRQQVWKILTASVFSKWVSSEDAVLDLGSGYCEFINNICARVKYAMDLNPAARAHAAPGVNVLLQDCADPWPLPPAMLDVVFTSNFFEHLPSKSALEQTLLNAFVCLKPGGRLIAMGPNIRYAGDAYWDFCDHNLPLTDLAVTELFHKSGLEIEYCRGRFLPYTMSKGPRYPLWMLKTYLKLPFVWNVFGAQFLIVGRRPGPVDTAHSTQTA